MKKYFLTTLASLFLLMGCSVNNNTDPQTIIVHWNLVKTTGGVAGVNDEFPVETIIWDFNQTDSKLTVVNNNTDDTKEDALDTGTYIYSETQANGKTYLNIVGIEFGGFTLSSTQLIIDQNDQSQGSGTDGYIYTFKKSVEIVE